MTPEVIVALAVNVVVKDPTVQIPSLPVVVTAGTGLMVKIMVATAGAQGAPKGLFVVRVSTTDPASISAGEGV